MNLISLPGISLPSRVRVYTLGGHVFEGMLERMHVPITKHITVGRTVILVDQIVAVSPCDSD